MTFIFRNRTIFWDISKWNNGQTNYDGRSISYLNQILFLIVVNIEVGNKDSSFS